MNLDRLRAMLRIIQDAISCPGHHAGEAVASFRAIIRLCASNSLDLQKQWSLHLVNANDKIGLLFNSSEVMTDANIIETMKQIEQHAGGRTVSTQIMDIISEHQTGSAKAGPKMDFNQFVDMFAAVQTAFFNSIREKEKQWIDETMDAYARKTSAKAEHQPPSQSGIFEELEEKETLTRIYRISNVRRKKISPGQTELRMDLKCEKNHVFSHDNEIFNARSTDPDLVDMLSTDQNKNFRRKNLTVNLTITRLGNRCIVRLQNSAPFDHEAQTDQKAS